MALTIHDEMFFNAAILAYKEILDSADAPATWCPFRQPSGYGVQNDRTLLLPDPLSPIRLVTPSASFARIERNRLVRKNVQPLTCRI